MFSNLYGLGTHVARPHRQVVGAHRDHPAADGTIVDAGTEVAVQDAVPVEQMSPTKDNAVDSHTAVDTPAPG